MSEEKKPFYKVVEEEILEIMVSFGLLVSDTNTEPLVKLMAMFHILERSNGIPPEEARKLAHNLRNIPVKLEECGLGFSAFTTTMVLKDLLNRGDEKCENRLMPESIT